MTGPLSKGSVRCERLDRGGVVDEDHLGHVMPGIRVYKVSGDGSAQSSVLATSPIRGPRSDSVTKNRKDRP
jgi:hypothetical protein